MFYFVLGMLFISIAQPILDGITSVILSFFEVIKARIAIDISKSNQKVEEFRQPHSSSHAIGFAVPTDDYYEEDEE